jgi:hypothetical protein
VTLTLTELREIMARNGPQQETVVEKVIELPKQTTGETSFLWRMGQSMVLIALPKIVPLIIGVVGAKLSKPQQVQSNKPQPTMPSLDSAGTFGASGYY